jgi:hypothetical protein
MNWSASDATLMLAVTNTSPWLMGRGSRKIDNRRSARASDEPGRWRIEHDVFVARQTSDGGAHRGGDAPPHLLEHAVAHGMAEAVVDVLEAVEVDEEDRARRTHRARLVDGDAQALAQQRAVGQAREPVMQRHVPQALLGAAVGTHGLRDRRVPHPPAPVPTPSERVRRLGRPARSPPVQ